MTTSLKLAHEACPRRRDRATWRIELLGLQLNRLWVALIFLTGVTAAPSICRAQTEVQIVTPIDLAARSLPISQTLGNKVLDLLIDGCKFHRSREGYVAPVEAEHRRCMALWEDDLTFERELPVRSLDGAVLGIYRFTRDFGEDGARYAADMTYDGSGTTVSTKQGVLLRLACNQGYGWMFIELMPTPSGAEVVDSKIANDLKRAVPCAAEVETPIGVRAVNVRQAPNVRLLALLAIISLAGAAILTALLTWLLFYRFRAAMEAKLKQASEADASPGRQESWLSPPRTLELVPLKEVRPTGLLQTISQLRRKSLVVQTVTSFGYAVSLAVAYLAPSGNAGSWRRVITVSLVMVWPLVPALWISTLHPGLRSRLYLLIGYSALFFGFAWVASESSPKNSAVLWLVLQSTSLPLIMAVLWKPVRSAAPWVFVATFCVLFGIQVSIFSLRVLEQKWLLGLFLKLGIDSPTIIILSVTIVILLVALPLYAAPLKGLERVYVGARLNERLVTLGSIWFLHGLAITLPAWHSTGQTQILFGCLAIVPCVLFFLYASRRRPVATPPRLLFLRSFTQKGGHADLFSELKRDLPWAIKAELIAGPDLATSLIEPAELFAFVAGKIGREYIGNLDEFSARSERELTQFDAEGRYRISDYYCANSTWKGVFSKLVLRADVVLMDLRGLSEERKGVAYELTELIHRTPLSRIILVMDAQGNQIVARALINNAWAKLPDSSPNLKSPDSRLSIFEYDRRRRGEFQRLISHICAVATDNHNRETTSKQEARRVPSSDGRVKALASGFDSASPL